MQKRILSQPTVAVITFTLFLALFSKAKDNPHFQSAQWPIAGQDLSNSWNQPAEHLINPANVHTLAPKWVFTTGSDVSATPTVDGEAVYVPDWAGNLFAIEKESGKLIWSHKISEYDGVTGSISRVTPALHGDEVIIGDILSANGPHNGANVIGLDRDTGVLRWITQVAF